MYLRMMCELALSHHSNIDEASSKSQCLCTFPSKRTSLSFFEPNLSYKVPRDGLVINKFCSKKKISILKSSLRTQIDLLLLFVEFSVIHHTHFLWVLMWALFLYVKGDSFTRSRGKFNRKLLFFLFGHANITFTALILIFITQNVGIYIKHNYYRLLANQIAGNSLCPTKSFQFLFTSSNCGIYSYCWACYKNNN